jgi:endonuclease YncB( thermonuclease family)
MPKAAVLAAFALWALLAAAGPAVLVDHVIDGDTVILADGRHVRLLGINAPELGRDGEADEPLAAAAAKYLRELVEDRTVRIEPGRGRDRYGRTLAWLHLEDGTDVQERMLRRGYAWAVAIAPDTGRADAYGEAEEAARSQRFGVWSQPEYAPQPAAAAGGRGGGFRILRGRVTGSRADRRRVLLVVDDAVEIWIDGDRWHRHWQTGPEAWHDRRVLVRGWLIPRRGRDRMYVDHPLMLRTDNDGGAG